MNTVKCHRCGKEVIPDVIDDGSRLLRANCPWCCVLLKNIPRPKNPAEEVMPFGKHKGKRFGEIPFPYLEWVWENASEKLESEARNNLIEYMRLHDVA